MDPQNDKGGGEVRDHLISGPRTLKQFVGGPQVACETLGLTEKSICIYITCGVA
jgi:hypothetical protein